MVIFTDAKPLCMVKSPDTTVISMVMSTHNTLISVVKSPGTILTCMMMFLCQKLIVNADIIGPDYDFACIAVVLERWFSALFHYKGKITNRFRWDLTTKDSFDSISKLHSMDPQFSQWQT